MPKVQSKAPKEAAPAPVVREYKLLVGQHVGPDLTEAPVIRKDPVSGVETRKWPSRTYAAGETVPSEMDLVARFGAEKFQYLGDPNPDSVYFGSGWQPDSTSHAAKGHPFGTGDSIGVSEVGAVGAGEQHADQASLLTSYASSPTAESSGSSSPKEPEGAPEDNPSHGRRGRRG